MADDNAEITTKYCLSCKQDVPSANFEMHVIHCQRFLTSCPQCGESVNKNLLQEHIDENHVQVKCDVCGENVEKMELEDHKTSSCQKRNVDCKYCEITLPACGIDEHKESCGSRTEECDNCKRRILVKDLEDHLASGCETLVKTNGKIGQDQGRVPEKLIGGQDDIRAIPRGSGFPFHPQFQPSPYLDEGTVTNPYFPSSRTLNNDVPKVSNPVPKNLQKKFTPTSSTASTKNISMKSRLLDSSSQGSIDVKSRGGTRKPSTLIEKYMEQKKARGLQQRPSYRMSDSDSDGDNGMEERKPPPDLTDETLLPCEFCDEMFPADSLGFHQANCDNVPSTPRPPSPPKLKRLSLDPFPSGGASSYEHYQDEAAALPSNGFPFRKNSPGIGDGSAPCEFCFSSIPLVDLALHQVTCQQNPNLQNSSTPEEYHRTSSPPPERKQRLIKTDLPIPSKSLLPRSHTPQVKPNNSEPRQSIIRPLDAQTKSKTSMSPNVQAREKRILAPNFFAKVTTPTPPSDTSTPTQPKDESRFSGKDTQPPTLTSNASTTAQPKNNSRFSGMNTQPPTLTSNASTPAQPKNNSRFSGMDTQIPTRTPDASTPIQPKIKSSLNDTSASSRTVEKKPQRNKRKSKPIPKRTPTFPQRFHEVNVLGGEKQQNERSFDSRALNSNPIESERPSNDFSEQFNRHDPVSNANSFQGFGETNNHAAKTKYPYQRNPQANRSDGVNQITNPRRINRGARGKNPTRGQNLTRGQYSTRGYNSTRGQNPTRGRNLTRGRSYGSNTVTIRPQRGNNPRQVSGTEERDVSSQPDLTLQGQAPSFDRLRSSGQRLGSGDSCSRPDRTRSYPPKNNNWN